MKILLLTLSFLTLISCSELSSILIEADPQNPTSPEPTQGGTETPFPVSASGVTFLENIEYGTHSRNKFDLFMPKSDRPTGIVIFIHGGGFVGGDKNLAYTNKSSALFINEILKKNIAFATINYQLLVKNDVDGVMKSLNDTKKALQFIRMNAQTYNLKKSDIILMGGSAGAGASLWLALKDDMANSAKNETTSGESTRVKGVIAIQTQASYDLLEWSSTVFNEYKPQGFDFNTISTLISERAIKQFYGVRNMEEVMSPNLQKERDELDFLSELTSDDPELYLENTAVSYKFPSNANALLHHPLHSKLLMDKANSVNVKTRVYLPTMNLDTREGEDMIDFVVRKFKE
ncbi:alpha/beta hydrolase [Brumimicrobium mesophilum]|uniref:alpha/beta hydrolase n=1 Tax=Brumimicrobium mesophilum TaxID=392717 RepID=UPI000D143804|nr:alpha/beta hydrolase [Brumimicrobium mesophilum]